MKRCLFVSFACMSSKKTGWRYSAIVTILSIAPQPTPSSSPLSIVSAIYLNIMFVQEAERKIRKSTKDDPFHQKPSHFAYLHQEVDLCGKFFTSKAHHEYDVVAAAFYEEAAFVRATTHVLFIRC